MEKILFDNGMKEYQIGDGGILRFNPSDPDVYARFMDAADKFRDIETGLVEKAKAANGDGEKALRILVDADKEAKDVLSWVFGKHNDFNEIVNGVNLLGVGANGERILTNLLLALTPIMQKGAEDCARMQATAAKTQAAAERAKRKN